MIRNTILYHRLWYVKRRSRKRIRVYLRLAVIFIIITLLVTYTQKRLLPYLAEIAEFKAKAIITETVSNAIINVFPEGTGYNDFAEIAVDSEGRITSIQADVTKMNRLSAQLSLEIQRKLSSLPKDIIVVPFGTLLGNSLFSGMGPDINVNIVPVGNVELEFKSEFTSAGINQTRHRIVLQAKTNVEIVAPLTKKKFELITDVPVAETIIVGNVPDYFINSGGTENK